jgi:hypothetical protein
MIMPGHWNAKKHRLYLILSPLPQWFNKSDTNDDNGPQQLVYLETSVMYMRSELVTEAIGIKPLAASITTKHFLYMLQKYIMQNKNVEQINIYFKNMW